MKHRDNQKHSKNLPSMDFTFFKVVPFLVQQILKFTWKHLKPSSMIKQKKMNKFKCPEKSVILRRESQLTAQRFTSFADMKVVYFDPLHVLWIV